MLGTIQQNLRNIPLSRIAAADFALLSPYLVAVDLPPGHTLAHPDTPVEHAWFVESGVGSIVAISGGGHRVQAGLFGRDGVAPASLILGVDTASYHIFMQVGGHGHRLPASVFASALRQSPDLRQMLGYYLQTLNTQTAYTALSNAVHQIDRRCARWLLMVHDRMDGDDIQLTHEFRALMLAVRRPSVTTALHVLEGHRLIRADRGWVTIRDRAALEEFAGDAYGRSEEEYARLICPLR